MTFKEAVRTCLSKYATFSGRASRSEYWWFALFNLIGALIAAVLDSVLGLRGAEGGTGLLQGLWTLVLFLPGLAAAVRRYHDADFRGWWILLPIVNLVLLFLKSTDGENRFGPKPELQEALA